MPCQRMRIPLQRPLREGASARTWPGTIVTEVRANTARGSLDAAFTCVADGMMTKEPCVATSGTFGTVTWLAKPQQEGSSGGDA